MNREMALKEPNLNNPRRQPGVDYNPLCSALKELNKMNYGKNFSSGVIPDSTKIFRYSSSNVTLL
jgi:hypothetical protein